jgi:hypothetical protein
MGLQGGLMGYVPQNAQIPQLPASTMGPWSQLAYQMAGSPHQGGALPSVAAPTAIPGSLSASGSSGGGTGAAILTGLLGAVAKNPGLVKSAYNGISGLLGGAPAPSVLAGGSPALSTVGTGAVAPAVDSAAADASSALADVPATGGLLGSAAAAQAGSALGAGAPGVFASGNAAAGSAGAGAAGGAGLGAAGFAIPLAAAAIPFMIGNAMTAKDTQGSAAMNAWMKATGANWKAAPSQSNVGQNTFGTMNSSGPTAGQGVSPSAGQMMGPNGQPMTPAQVVNAISAWAQQNGVNPGDFHPVG